MAGRDSRGQLLIVSALALAVLIVAIALFQVGVHPDGGREHSLDFENQRWNERIGEDTLRLELARINHPGIGQDRPYGELITRLDESIAVLSRAYDRQNPASSVEVSRRGQTNGTRIVQYAIQGFQNASGHPNWTLAQNVERTQSFRMAIEQDELQSGNTDWTAQEFIDSAVFRVWITTDSGDEWAVFIYKPQAPGTDVAVQVIELTPTPMKATSACERDESDPIAPIDFERHTVAGAHCPGLASFKANGTLRFEHTETEHGTETITGRYELQVSEPEASIDVRNHYYNEGTNNSPVARESLSRAIVRFDESQPERRLESVLILDGPVPFRHQITDRQYSQANSRPDAKFLAIDTGPRTTLDASNASDPDGHITEYLWDFDSDGTVDDRGQRVETTLPPDAQVTLIVFDDERARDQRVKIIE